jgi:titin
VALSAGGESPASDPSGSVVPASPAVSATPPDTNLPLDTGVGPISTAAPGQAILLKGDGYAPYSAITLAIYSSPQVLGAAVAGADGSFQKLVTVPDGLPAGAHSLVAAGVGPDGLPRALRLDVTVASTGSGATLPITGPAVLWLFVGGFALTVAGVAMRVVTR